VSWTVEAGEQRFWPDGDEPGSIPPGGLEAVFVPVEAGEIVVTGYAQDDRVAALDRKRQLQWRYTWDGTDLPCQEFPAPSLVPGSCEGPATLTIPAMLEEVGPTLL